MNSPRACLDRFVPGPAYGEGADFATSREHTQDELLPSPGLFPQTFLPNPYTQGIARPDDTSGWFIGPRLSTRIDEQPVGHVEPPRRISVPTRCAIDVEPSLGFAMTTLAWRSYPSQRAEVECQRSKLNPGKRVEGEAESDSATAWIVGLDNAAHGSSIGIARCNMSRQRQSCFLTRGKGLWCNRGVEAPTRLLDADHFDLAISSILQMKDMTYGRGPVYHDAP